VSVLRLQVAFRNRQKIIEVETAVFVVVLMADSMVVCSVIPPPKTARWGFVVRSDRFNERKKPSEGAMERVPCVGDPSCANNDRVDDARSSVKLWVSSVEPSFGAEIAPFDDLSTRGWALFLTALEPWTIQRWDASSWSPDRLFLVRNPPSCRCHWEKREG
jgi:hypothetical protein